MAAISTPSTAIDRKLHRIVLDANPSHSPNMVDLATAIKREKYQEFSYTRSGKTEFSSAAAIQKYVSYAHAIELLDSNLGSSRLKKDIRDLQSFQQWLGDAVLDYLSRKGCNTQQIGNVIEALLHAPPYKLPTREKVRSQFKDPPSEDFFRFSLKIVALLRPAVLLVKSRSVVLMPGLLEE
jgi:hypothetical protein